MLLMLVHLRDGTFCAAMAGELQAMTAATITGAEVMKSATLMEDGDMAIKKY
jgi:hypothetical protein